VTQTNPSLFCALLSSLYAPGKTFRSVTHPEIAPGQARLTLEFFADGLPEKKLQLSGISMLLILLSRGMLQLHAQTNEVSVRGKLSRIDK
jgi:hypothetical protein